MGDECLRNRSTDATERLIDRLVSWSGSCLLLLAFASDQCEALCEGSDTTESIIYINYE